MNKQTTNHITYTYCDCLIDPKIDKCYLKDQIKTSIWTIDIMLVLMLIGLCLYW